MSKYLLTPGPLTTAPATREAMLRDWGSRDDDFKALTKRVRVRLTALAGGVSNFSTVPVQGSGTFAIEAAVGTFVTRDGRLLVLVNGAYGRRIARIAEIIGRDVETYETEEDTPPDMGRLDEFLAADPNITHVAAVHCETTSGLLNPIADVAAVVARHGRNLLIDAMSSFGALPLDVGQVPCTAIVSSANKCLEGVPGLSFVVAETGALAAAAGNAHSLSLDLHDQWLGFEKSGEWRFTPPTHVLAALDAALDAHEAEGGIDGRRARYSRNCELLTDGMRGLGFETFLSDSLQAPIIVTFRTPADPAFDFDRFYQALHGKGYAIYPGKLTRSPSFRIGCIGHVDEAVMRGVVSAVGDVLDNLGVANGRPVAA